MYRITINKCIDLNRKKKSSKRNGKIFSLFTGQGKISIEPPDFQHPGVLLEQQEKAKVLFKAVDSLPEQQKTAFVLSYLEDLPRQQVAEIMHLSLKAVESLLQRAKNYLRKNLPLPPKD